MTTEPGVDDDNGLGVGHPSPPLQERMILIDQRPDDRANVEGLLPVGIRRRGPDVADGGEVAAVQ